MSNNLIIDRILLEEKINEAHSNFIVYCNEHMTTEECEKHCENLLNILINKEHIEECEVK